MIPAHQEMESIWLTVCLDVSFLFSSLNEQLANVNLPIVSRWADRLTVGESNGGILLFVMGEGNDRFRRVCLTCGIAQQNGNNEALHVVIDRVVHEGVIAICQRSLCAM